MPEGAPSLRKQILPKRNRPGRGCHEEHEFQEPSPVGQYGATNKACFSSSQILHSFCASRLTGGNAFFAQAPGASCVPVHLCQALPQLGSKTTGSGRFLEMQKDEQLRNSEPSPNQLNCLGMESPLPWKYCSRQLFGCLIEHSWDVDGTKGPQMLLTSEEEVAGELRHVTGA